MSRSIALTPFRAVAAGACLILIGAVGAGALAAGAGGTLPRSDAAATTVSDPTTALVPDAADVVLAADTTRQAAGPARLAGLLGLLRRTDRAEISVRTATGETSILYVRGTVAAVTASSITITLRDGSTQAYAIDASTKIRGGGKTLSIGDLAAGDRAMVFGIRAADGTWTSRLVRCVRPGTGPNRTAPRATAGPDASGSPSATGAPVG